MWLFFFLADKAEKNDQTDILEPGLDRKFDGLDYKYSGVTFE